jgi:hypothetical protein
MTLVIASQLARDDFAWRRASSRVKWPVATWPTWPEIFTVRHASRCRFIAEIGVEESVVQLHSRARLCLSSFPRLPEFTLLRMLLQPQQPASHFAATSSRPPSQLRAHARPVPSTSSARPHPPPPPPQQLKQPSTGRTANRDRIRSALIRDPSPPAPPPLSEPAKPKEDKVKLTERWGSPPTLIKRDGDMLQRGELLGEVCGWESE